MSRTQLDPQVVRMPELAAGDWLNSDKPLTKDMLRGQVVLIDFWDYTCINCIRTLPYITQWHARYASLGLIVIGVHAPEFAFARTRKQIEASLEEFHIQYPVLLDNDYETWLRFANRAWPTKYLIDPQGYIRLIVQGEGRYQEMEFAIQDLLRQRDKAAMTFPDPLPLLRPEDAPGAICYRPTPELYAGYQRGSLGNAEGYAPGTPIVYEMPPHEDRVEQSFYAGGIWRAEKEALAFAGQNGGQILLPYSAATVNAVLSPSADPVELLLDLPPEADRRKTVRNAPPIIEVLQDGHYLRPEDAGDDIEYDDGGLSYVTLGRPRLFQLVNNPSFESHELALTFRANGLALYAFTFTTCLSANGES